MSGLRLLPLGVGDAYSALRYTTSLAIEAEGAWLLIDCPHPIRKMMREASATAGVQLDIDRISAVALTHLHGDHCSGLEIFGYYSRFELDRITPLLAHPTVSERLWDHCLSASMRWSRQGPGEPPIERRFDDYFQLMPLSQNTSVQVGPFAVRCHPTQHSIPTSAMMVHAAGRTLAYSADTPFDPALINWLASADLIVHESTPGRMHTPYDQLAALPRDLRAKMRLIHYPDNFDLTGREIEPLHQGRIYDI